MRIDSILDCVIEKTVDVRQPNQPLLSGVDQPSKVSPVSPEGKTHVTYRLTSLPIDIFSLSLSSAFLRDLSNREDLSFHSSNISFWSF